MIVSSISGWRGELSRILNGAVQIDNLLQFLGAGEVVYLNFHAVLPRRRYPDPPYIGHSLEEGLVDLNVPDVVVEDLGRRLREKPAVHDGPLCGDLKGGREPIDPPPPNKPNP